MFTLSIFCLTTFNLPWFMDLTFQVPMQCSLHYQTLLPSPVTSTTGCCFCFGSISSFFLELFPHWSPVAYWSIIRTMFEFLYCFICTIVHSLINLSSHPVSYTVSPWLYSWDGSGGGGLDAFLFYVKLTVVSFLNTNCKTVQIIKYDRKRCPSSAPKF